jgi:hypothetical protein
MLVPASKLSCPLPPAEQNFCLMYISKEEEKIFKQ